MLLDDSRAVLGSIALSALSLDFRREVSLLIDDAVAVKALGEFVREITDRAGGPTSILPGDAAA
jgi:hypothetical protein